MISCSARAPRFGSLEKGRAPLSAAFRQRRRRLRRLPRAERIFAAEPRHVQVSNSRFNSPFKILPLGLRGHGSGQNATFTGTLKAARRAATNSRNSASVALEAGLGGTTAHGY